MSSKQAVSGSITRYGACPAGTPLVSTRIAGNRFSRAQLILATSASEMDITCDGNGWKCTADRYVGLLPVVRIH
jgi:hypothetical protein